MPEQVAKWFEWDGKIPLWGILVAGLTLVVYGWNWVEDIERRLSTREQQAAVYRQKVDQLVEDRSRLVQLEVEIKYIRAGIERIEQRFSAPPVVKP